MATFEAKKLELTLINGGQEYEQGDFLQSDTINDVVEGTAYAQNVAEEANTKSNNAVSTANSANKTANDASTKVDTFDQRITTAQNTANKAVSNAATAQSTADSATTEINKIKNGTTVVPNANHANNADNANLATKAQQDVNGNSIVDTYATKTEVAEKQGTKVYYGSALQTSVTFDSDPQTQINDIVSGAQTVGKATQDANGNVIDTTYAKLSQVVRTDAAQSLTDEEKTRAKDNVAIRTEKAAETGISTGWYRVAKLDRQSVYSVTIGQDYNYCSPTNIKLALNLGYQEAVITQENGIVAGNLQIDRVRVCVGTTADAFFDVHIFNANCNTTKISIDRLYNGYDAVAIETYENWEYIGTSDTVSGYNVTLLDIVNGTNTSGQVYQQGAPVFATDPSKLAPSTANGWTQTTATGTLPSAGVYMVTPNVDSGGGLYGIGVMFYDGEDISSTVIGNPGGSCVLYYLTSGGTRWELVDHDGGTQIQLTDVYYKRIA